MTHYLKTWPDVFQETWLGKKVHEWRRDDRHFEIGDLIILEEFEPVGDRYLGRIITAEITSISRGPEWGIPLGFAVFSIRLISKKYRREHDGKDEG